MSVPVDDQELELARKRRNQARYYDRYPERAKAATRRWREKNAAKLRDQRLEERYGLPPGEFDRMFKAQEGKCAICLEPPTGRGTNSKLHVDHDHATGKVRGLLCQRCNAGLGWFRDRPNLLKNAANYLDQQQPTQ